MRVGWPSFSVLGLHCPSFCGDRPGSLRSDFPRPMFLVHPSLISASLFFFVLVYAFTLRPPVKCSQRRLGRKIECSKRSMDSSTSPALPFPPPLPTLLPRQAPKRSCPLGHASRSWGRPKGRPSAEPRHEPHASGTR